jgi:hypothetical protein
MHDKVKENRVDDIISQTLDTIHSFSVLRKSPILRDQLRKYIKEHIEYTEFSALVKQVNNLLDNQLQVGGTFIKRDGLTNSIRIYNEQLDYLIKLNCNESQKFSKISINDFHPEEWSLDGADETLMLFKKYDDKLSEMWSIRNTIILSIDKIQKKTAPYIFYFHEGNSIELKRQKPSHIDMDTFIDYIKEIYTIYSDLDRIKHNYYGCMLPHPDDRYLSYYNKIVDDLITKIS